MTKLNIIIAIQVVTMGLLDREKADKYQVIIECEDGGDPSLKTSRELSIRVLDYNDNAPEFGQNVYTQVSRLYYDLLIYVSFLQVIPQ